MKNINILSLAVIGLSMISCGKSHNEKMTDLIMSKRALEDSLNYFEKIESNAKIAIDTLTDYDLLKIDTNFIHSQGDIRIKNYPNIYRIETKLKKVNNSIDSLEKMK